MVRGAANGKWFSVERRICEFFYRAEKRVKIEMDYFPPFDGFTHLA
jgi:hypothetical protein